MTTETNLDDFTLGTTWEITFALNDADGNDLDLTGATVAFRLARNNVLALLFVSPGSDVSVDSPSQGQGTITVTPADQAHLVPAVYTYELQATLSDGRVTTQARGAVTVHRSLFA